MEMDNGHSSPQKNKLKWNKTADFLPDFRRKIKFKRNEFKTSLQDQLITALPDLRKRYGNISNFLR
jgi:hypothetical protein